VTLARHPVSGSVGVCCIEHGTGALNIDGSRIDGKPRSTHKDGNKRTKMQSPSGWKLRGSFKLGEYEVASGRWPSNMILQHKAGCRQIGIEKAPGYTINRWTDGAKPFGGGAGHEYESEEQPEETVPVWHCAEDCAVLDLGAQGGVTKSTGGKGAASGLVDNPGIYGKYSGENKGASAGGFGDVGDVARYFKQVKEDK
jgi:hypothetical protein